ncbi:hypothetical protein K1719_046478 [Acacia pycnantha]|nr:hypothetical protein K1719_046478 [Acacia pycnantha]
MASHNFFEECKMFLWRFQENSAKRRSPDQGLTWLLKVVHMEVVEGVWRRNRAGMVKRTMKNRVAQRLY